MIQDPLYTYTPDEPHRLDKRIYTFVTEDRHELDTKLEELYRDGWELRALTAVFILEKTYVEKHFFEHFHTHEGRTEYTAVLDRGILKGKFYQITQQRVS